MLHYEINQKQYDILLGLRHWFAVKAKMQERNPADLKRDGDNIHKTICSLFNEADALNIPFWVQNTVCAYQDDWRHISTTYLYQDLEKNNINCSAVTCR